MDSTRFKQLVLKKYREHPVLKGKRFSVIDLQNTPCQMLPCLSIGQMDQADVNFEGLGFQGPLRVIDSIRTLFEHLQSFDCGYFKLHLHQATHLLVDKKTGQRWLIPNLSPMVPQWIGEFYLLGKGLYDRPGYCERIAHLNLFPDIHPIPVFCDLKLTPGAWWVSHRSHASKETQLMVRPLTCFPEKGWETVRCYSGDRFWAYSTQW